MAKKTKKKQEKWFSWGWFIFWTIFTGLFSFVYLAIKYAQKIDNERKG